MTNERRVFAFRLTDLLELRSPIWIAEGLERPGEDLAPALEVGQLLRTSDQTSKEHGDGAKRLGGLNRPGVRASDLDRRLARMPHTFGGGMKQQGAAGDSSLCRSGSARRTKMFHQS